MAFLKSKGFIKTALISGIVFLGLVLLLLKVAPAGSPIETPEYEKHVNQICNDFSKWIKEELGFNCCGGGGRMPEDVEEITLFFQAHRRATIEEARALNILMTEKLVKAINAHEKIQPFLHERPFPVHRVSLDIRFVNDFSDTHCDGSVSTVSHICPLAPFAPVIYSSSLVYSARDGFTGNNIEIYEEPYSEAEAIVKASGITEPPPHCITEKERALDEIFGKAYQEMWEKHGLHIWHIGCKMLDELEELGVKLVAYHPATQEQARELAVIAAERICEFVNQSLTPSFSSEKIKMRISFKKKRGYDFGGGSMESLVLEGDELIYYRRELTEKGNRALPPIVEYAKEPYQVALNLVGLKKIR